MMELDNYMFKNKLIYIDINDIAFNYIYLARNLLTPKVNNV